LNRKNDYLETVLYFDEGQYHKDRKHIKITLIGQPKEIEELKEVLRKRILKEWGWREN